MGGKRLVVSGIAAVDKRSSMKTTNSNSVRLIATFYRTTVAKGPTPGLIRRTCCSSILNLLNLRTVSRKQIVAFPSRCGVPCLGFT